VKHTLKLSVKIASKQRGIKNTPIAKVKITIPHNLLC